MCEVMYLNGNQFLNEHSLLEILCDSAAGFERLECFWTIEKSA